jgi:hypothetical protein
VLRQLVDEPTLLEDATVVLWGVERSCEVCDHAVGYNNALKLHSVKFLLPGVNKVLGHDGVAGLVDGTVDEPNHCARRGTMCA